MLAGESEISKIIKMNLLSSETVKIKIKDGMAFKIGRSYKKQSRPVPAQNENWLVTMGKPPNK